MSYQTLKQKIEELIYRTGFGNQWSAILRNEPAEFIVPDGVEEISVNQLSFAPKSITKVYAKDLKTVATKFFQNCTGLTEVELPNLTEAGSYCFQNCAGLTEVELPNLVEAGNATFNGCPLTEVNFPKVDNLLDSLRGIESLVTINMPSATTFSHSQAINGCSALKTLTLGALTSTGSYSFRQSTVVANNTLEFVSVGKGTKADLYLQYSERYSQETLHAIIDNLADLTGSSQKKFQVGETNLAKISKEYVAKLEAKNWSWT